MAISSGDYRVPILVAAAVMQLLATNLATAESTEAGRIATLEQRLEQSLNRIDQLEKRLSSPAPADSAAMANTNANEQSQELEQLQNQVNTLAQSAATKRDMGLPLHGFGAIGYSQTSDDPTGAHSGFLLSNFDFYMTPSFGPHVESITELNFEYGTAGELTTDLERMEIGYLFSDALTLWMGRFHTPYGFWNAAYHHGTQMQPSILRPRFVDFEDRGGILPAHSVGLNAAGHWRLGAGRLEYDLFLANGDRIAVNTLEFNPYKDDNGNKLLGANVRYNFGDLVDGLTLGLHGYTDAVNSVDAFNAITARTRVTMVGGFAILERDTWQVLSEYYHFQNENRETASSHSSWAAYAQIGYTIHNLYMPYVRYEKASLDQSDAYFANQASGRSYTRDVLGLRYSLYYTVSLKGEWLHTNEQQPTGAQNFNELRFELAVAF